MNSLTAYIAIGAVLLGIAIGHKSEECGSLQRPRIEDTLIIVMAWPAPLIVALFFDVPDTPPSCDGENK